MAMDLWRRWIKPSDKIPLLFGMNMLLTLDYNYFVCPNGITESFHIRV